MTQIIKKNKCGFTLIEIMVAVSIFTLVAMVTTGTLVALSAANRKLQNIKTAVDNLNFTLNNIAIRIREGRGADLDEAWNDCRDSIKFRDFDGEYIEYSRGLNGANYSVQRKEGSSPSDLNNSEAYPLTSAMINITDLEFCPIQKTGCNDCKQAISINVVGVINQDKKDEAIFKLQTSVVQRNK